MWDKMDDEKKQKLTTMLKDLGIDEKMIDEHLIWKVKKSSFKLMKLRLMLDEKGLSEADTKKILDKLVEASMKKDLAKIKEWQEEHEDKEHCHCPCHRECHCDCHKKD
jgi:hypothetical protein